ncbi:hypothetical protein [Streptomyces violarus]|uniref:hypothetical protein n=1 Tax=Streptomyces violarus TaxID=67380 RepID=UPI0021BE6069|nr:hypothetical protein [Streptomyces violarus]MCT9144093.1 hypothetical protein [Streptomyces violarus]
MGMTGERRHRVWRWAVIVWVLAVAVGGGLTLWVQDSTEPQGPYVRQQTKPGATPDVPPCPAPDEGGAALCVYTDAD